MRDDLQDSPTPRGVGGLKFTGTPEQNEDAKSHSSRSGRIEIMSGIRIAGGFAVPLLAEWED